MEVLCSPLVSPVSRCPTWWPQIFIHKARLFFLFQDTEQCQPGRRPCRCLPWERRRARTWCSSQPAGGEELQLVAGSEGGQGLPETRSWTRLRCSCSPSGTRRSPPSPVNKFTFPCHNFYQTIIIDNPCHSLRHWLLLSRLDWCDHGMWRCQLKTCWGSYCCWWGLCWQQFVADLEAEVWP